ncbi:RlmE family RNA methyltransferase [Bdellovibrionota bacterium FG-1]
MAYNPQDYYFKKAKKENYAARAVFKIQEIDEKFKIFKPGYKVLDLGAAPGSWTQYASQKVQAQGRILGIDLVPIKVTLPNALFIAADMRQLDLAETMAANGITPPFDVVLSDMAPKTTGIRVTDQMRSLELCELALATAERFLKPRGSFVAKLFHSDEFEGFRNKLRERFGRVEVLRPQSTRKESKEIFFIAMMYGK